MAQQMRITQTSNADMNIGVTKTQTAVEWLENQIKSIDIGSGIKMKIDIPKEFLEQAKQMEKEQIMKAFSVGDDCGYRFAITEDSQQFNSAEQYYNETYN